MTSTKPSCSVNWHQVTLVSKLGVGTVLLQLKGQRKPVLYISKRVEIFQLACSMIAHAVKWTGLGKA